MAKGELDTAIEWLEKAKLAPRYEPRHFPFMNLGRLYAAKGMVMQAIREFEGALEIEPGEPTCVELVAKLRRMLNWAASGFGIGRRTLANREFRTRRTGELCSK
jgi:Tfp pilus assembly protein PilF